MESYLAQKPRDPERERERKREIEMNFNGERWCRAISSQSSRRTRITTCKGRNFQRIVYACSVTFYRAQPAIGHDSLKNQFPKKEGKLHKNQNHSRTTPNKTSQQRKKPPLTSSGEDNMPRKEQISDRVTTRAVLWPLETAPSDTAFLSFVSLRPPSLLPFFSRHDSPPPPFPLPSFC